MESFPENIKQEGESLIYSIQIRDKRAFQILLKAGIPVTFKRSHRRLTALDAASEADDMYFLEELIKNRVDVNYYRKYNGNEHPIFRLMYEPEKNLKKVKLLLKSGLNPNMKDDAGIDLFERAIYSNMIIPFLNYPVNIKNGIKTLIYLAKAYRQKKNLEYIIENQEKFHPYVKEQLRDKSIKLLLV